MSFELFEMLPLFYREKQRERERESNNYDLDFNPQHHIQDRDPKPHMALFPNINTSFYNLLSLYLSVFKETFLHDIVPPPPQSLILS